MKEVKIEDDGQMALTLRGVRKELDLYDVFNRLAALDARARDEFSAECLATQEREYHVRVVALLEGLGYPAGVTHKEAAAFDAAVHAAVAEVKKNPPPEPTPG